MITLIISGLLSTINLIFHASRSIKLACWENLWNLSKKTRWQLYLNSSWTTIQINIGWILIDPLYPLYLWIHHLFLLEAAMSLPSFSRSLISLYRSSLSAISSKSSRDIPSSLKDYSLELSSYSSKSSSLSLSLYSSLDAEKLSSSSK